MKSFIVLTLAVVLCSTNVIAEVPAPAPAPVVAPVPGPDETLGCNSIAYGSTVDAPKTEYTLNGEALESGAIGLPLDVNSEVVTALALTTCLEGTDFATALYVLTPGETELSNAICSNEGLCGPNGDHAQIADCPINVENSMEYQVVVTGPSAEEGNFELGVTCVDPNWKLLNCGDVVDGNTEDGLIFPERDAALHLYILQVLEESNTIFLSTCFPETDYASLLLVYPLEARDFTDEAAICSSLGQTCEDNPNGALIEDCALEPGLYFLKMTGANEEGNYRLELECLEE